MHRASAIGISLSDCSALVIITNETGSSGSSQGGKWTLGSQKLHPKPLKWVKISYEGAFTFSYVINHVYCNCISCFFQIDVESH